MILDVNPTRMELLRLRKRIAVARRGHKLLKDKQDELMRKFLAYVHEVRKLREEVEVRLQVGYERLLVARSTLERNVLEEAVSFPSLKVKLSFSLTNIMNVRVPHFRLQTEGNIHPYGLFHTSGDLDIALSTFSDLLPQLVRLAELEKTVELLAAEIERTRRRVNALEYVLIPNLVETIKYISMKLGEMERANLTRLMKIKDIVRAH